MVAVLLVNGCALPGLLRTEDQDTNAHSDWFRDGTNYIVKEPQDEADFDTRQTGTLGTLSSRNTDSSSTTSTSTST